ncbi:MAG: alkaline phosphatase [bacterium]|jgi:alkaline phosphatase
MKSTACSLLIAAAAAILLNAAVPPSAIAHDREQGNGRGARNVIFMVPDGMGLADVTAARIFKNGIDGAPLHFETLDHIGYQRTYSANSTITDSAPAASAWACGEKFNNGEICFHGNGRPHLPSILEIAKRTGRGTGLVATSTITHATPASFGAHVANRNCETEIARQYIEVTRPDILLGGGAAKFNPANPDACGAKGDYVSKAEQSGYTVVQTRQEMKESAAGGAWKVLGLFTPEGMTPEVLRIPGTTEPRLPEMTITALDILERNRNGFFLMVEGSQVDWANHANDLAYQIGETLAFDEAVKAVLNWIDANPERREHTLLIVSPDHETGGFAINGPANRLLRAGESVTAAWTTKDHTGSDVPVWAQGPGSAAVGRALNNTDLYNVMKRALKADE